MGRHVGSRYHRQLVFWICRQEKKLLEQSVTKIETNRATVKQSMAANLDITWITEQLAVGGGVWNEQNMIELVRRGVTHIINMQIEFDDRPLAEPYGVKVLWNAVEDDFQPKAADVFHRGFDFAREAWKDDNARVFVHCAAGVHRAPMMTLALLRSQGWKLQEAMDSISTLRPVVDWAEVYVKSVEAWVKAAKVATSR
jgi:protein-tyrosine phosphatase